MTVKLPVIITLKQAYEYCKQEWKIFSLFAGLNFVATIALDLVGGWKSPAFLFILLFLYILWGVFFRIMFNKRPLFLMKSFTESLSPSTKILLLMFLFGTIFVLLPFIFVFLGLPINFLERHMENSYTLDLCLGLVFLFLSPQVLARPYFAWISAMIGRNKSLSYAFDKTRGNYWQILFLMFLLNLLFIGLGLTIHSVWVQGVFASIIFAYFNVVLAKAYDFFFKI